MNSHAFFAILLSLLLKGSLVLLLAMVADLLLRPASAATRHLVWLAALAALWLLPLTAPVAPRWSWAWDGQPPPVVVRFPAQFAVLPSAPSGAAEIKAAPVANPERRAWPRISWTALAVWLWLAGALALLTRPALFVRRLRAAVRDSNPATDERAWRALEELRREGGAVCPLRESRNFSVPLFYGLWRPVILLPESARAWSDDQVRAAIRHECGHLARRDCLTRWLLDGACALHWVNPLVWLAARVMRLRQEQACDDLVLHGGALPADYARQLVEVARSFAASGSPRGPALAMAHPSTLEQRVRAIVDPERARGAASHRARWGSGAGALLTLAACALAQIRAAETATTAASTPPSSAAGQDDARVVIESKFIELTPPLNANEWAKLVEPGAHEVQVMESGEYESAIRTLSQRRGADILGAPRLTARSGQRATIEVTREFAFPSTWEPGTEKGQWRPAGETRKDLGIKLEATAEIRTDGAVALQMVPSQTELLGFVDWETGLPEGPRDESQPRTRRVRPVFSERKQRTGFVLQPGQSALIFHLPQIGETKPFGGLPRTLLVFVSARVIEPNAGLDLGSSGAPVSQPAPPQAQGAITATADSVTYSESTKVLELDGSARLKTRGAVVSGDNLTVTLKPAPDAASPARDLAAHLIIPRLEFREATVREALDYLAHKSQELDPEKRGTNFILRAPAEFSTKITLSLSQVPLLEAVKYVASLAGLEMIADPHALVLQSPAPPLNAVAPPLPKGGDGVFLDRAAKMVIAKLDFNEASLDEAVAFLRAKSTELSPEKRPVNIVVHHSKASAEARITMRLQDAPLPEIVRYTAQLAGLECDVRVDGFYLHPAGK